jgi:CBS domain containing-hemolysin-like protein
MDPGSILLKIAAVLFLVGVNAYFVAAEFSLVAVRRARIEQRIRAGDLRARRVMAALDHLDDFISAAQLGITIASIGIGFVAESAFHDLLAPAIDAVPATWWNALPFVSSASAGAHVVSTIITLLIVTYLHVVIGEQVPKMISIQKAEAVALVTVGPTQFFGAVLRPLIRFMSTSANVVTRMLGLQPNSAHSLAHTPDEIRILVEQSQQEGMVEAGEEQMIQGVFELGEMVAREVMVPRRDFVALPVDATRDQVISLVTREAHSRIPVYEGDLDHIVGVLLAKDLLSEIVNGKGPFELRAILREACFVPDTKPVTDLLGELRARSVHMAIVVDEFGGTEGLVTLEDLLEEIVGDINDEHDQPEQMFRTLPGGDVVVDGGASIADVNEKLGLELREGDFETVGGYVFGELGRVPVKGDRVPVDGAGTLSVEATRKRRITLVRYIPEKASSAPTRSDAASHL